MPTLGIVGVYERKPSHDIVYIFVCSPRFCYAQTCLVSVHLVTTDVFSFFTCLLNNYTACLKRPLIRSPRFCDDVLSVCTQIFFCNRHYRCLFLNSSSTPRAQPCIGLPHDRCHIHSFVMGHSTKLYHYSLCMTCKYLYVLN